jgi:hypothetical protein
MLIAPRASWERIDDLRDMATPEVHCGRRATVTWLGTSDSVHDVSGRTGPVLTHTLGSARVVVSRIGTWSV